MKSVYRPIIVALLLAGCATQEIRHAQDEPGFREASTLVAEGRVEDARDLRRELMVRVTAEKTEPLERHDW